MLIETESQQDCTAYTKSARPQCNGHLFYAQESARPCDVRIRNLYGAQDFRPCESECPGRGIYRQEGQTVHLRTPSDSGAQDGKICRLDNPSQSPPDIEQVFTAEAQAL